MEAQGLINMDDPDDMMRVPEIKALLDTHAGEVQSVRTADHTRRPPRNPRPQPSAREGNKHSRRKQRRVEYARVQELFKADKNRCAQVVLNGHWRYDLLNAAPAVSKEEQEAFWGRLSPRPSPPDTRPVYPIRDPQWGMLDPITVEEVAANLQAMPLDSAAGPDRLTVRQLKSCPRSTLARLFNLWLYTSHEALKHARTTLIPKARQDHADSQGTRRHHARQVSAHHRLLRACALILQNFGSTCIEPVPI